MNILDSPSRPSSTEIGIRILLKSGSRCSCVLPFYDPGLQAQGHCHLMETTG